MRNSNWKAVHKIHHAPTTPERYSKNELLNTKRMFIGDTQVCCGERVKRMSALNLYLFVRFIVLAWIVLQLNTIMSPIVRDLGTAQLLFSKSDGTYDQED